MKQSPVSFVPPALTALFLLVSAPALVAAGGDGPATDEMLAPPLDVMIDPITPTNVGNREPVTYEVTVRNDGQIDQQGYLWFTVLLTGLENEKPVQYPYIRGDLPMGGEIRAGEEVVLRFDAWPLANIPRGLYIYWAKVGRFMNIEGDVNVDAKSSFHGQILEAPGPAGGDLGRSADMGMGFSIGAIRPGNEAGRRFLGEAGVGAVVRRASPSRATGAPVVPGESQRVRLIGNEPNPFHPRTRIAYEVRPGDAGRVPVRLEVYDVRGRKVRTLVSAEMPAGEYAVAWDGRDARGASVREGAYLFRMRSGRDVSVRKGILVR